MSVTGVPCLRLSLLPFSLPPDASFSFSCHSIPPNRHPNRIQLNHRLITSSCHKSSDKSEDAQAAPSYYEGDVLDKNGTSRNNMLMSKEYVIHQPWFALISLSVIEVLQFWYFFSLLMRLLKKLKRYGVSGVLSYGILNTIYYSIAFLLVWFYVAPSPGKMGYLAATQRFLKVMAMVWAGSQVTKLIRVGGALAVAPIVDKGLSWFTTKFKFENEGKAFGAMVGICVGVALMLFLLITLFSVL